MSVTLVTGANGFLGGAIASGLRGRGQVVGADVSTPTRSVFEEFSQVDVADESTVLNLVERLRPDRVYHFAGVMGADEVTAFRVNATGTVNLLEAVRRKSPRARVLVVGSAAEYGSAPLGTAPFAENAQCQPRDPYGASKLAATQSALSFFRQHALDVLVVRPFNIVGAGMRDSLVVGALATRAARAAVDGSDTLRVGNLDAVRDFVAVTDVATGCRSAMERGNAGEIYNICTGRGTTIRSVAERFIVLTGRQLHLEVDPALDRGADSSVGDPTKSKAQLGFVAATSLDATLREIWDSAVAHRAECASAS